jgi:hypothetical protein
MRRRKKPQPTAPGLFDPASILSSARDFVDPQPIIDAEFARAKRELLASAEQDMSLIEKIRFRIELWRLRNRYRKLKNDITNW